MEQLEKLKKEIRGEIILSTDDKFEDIIKDTFNYEVIKNHSPILIVQPLTVVDVIKTLKFIHSAHLQYGVRAGGYCATGSSFVKDGVMIDLSLMKSVHIDLRAKEVVVEPGCTVEDLDYETTQFDCAVPSGTYKHLGISGLALHGGFGVLSRKFGLMCDNLISVDIVLPNEKFIQVDDKTRLWGLFHKESAELMYGIRY